MKIIKILHPQFGLLQEEMFDDDIQFKIYLNVVHSCLELKQDLTIFNGKDSLLHIPYILLKESIVTGNVEKVSLAKYAIYKSKIEK